MIEFFSKAISDCFDEEMILLNEDIKEDAIFSGIKNLISGEYVEIRGGTGEDYLLTSGGQNEDDDDDGDHIILKGIGYNHSNHTRDNSAVVESVIESNDGGDDERSDFLTAKTNGTSQDIPNLIVFKPKKMRRATCCDEIQSQERSLRMKSRSNYSYIRSISPNHQVKPVATNQYPLKLSRWKIRRKRGFLTTQKPRTYSFQRETS